MKIRHNLIFLLIISPFILLGCSKYSKERVEIKFKEYVQQNFANPDDLEEIVSVIKTDSTDLEQMIKSAIETYDSTQEIMDSLSSRLKEVLPATKTSIIYSSDVQAALNNQLNVLDLKKYDYAFGKIYVNNLQEILDSIPSNKLKHRGYEIKTKIKGYPEIVTYYGVEWAGVDSISFSREKIKAYEMPDLENKVSLCIEETLKSLEAGKEINESIADVLIKIERRKYK